MPCNIGITSSGSPKLPEFGLARAADDAAARQTKPTTGPHSCDVLAGEFVRGVHGHPERAAEVRARDLSGFPLPNVSIAALCLYPRPKEAQ